MSAIQKIGIVGLGKMGLPMAKHLLAQGFRVAGCDRLGLGLPRGGDQ